MLPADVQRLVNETLTAVRTNPNHEMSVAWRIAIFAAIETADPLRGRKAHAWAAVHTAEFVLSCWKETGLQHKSWIYESRICLAQAKHHLSNYNRARLSEREDRVQNLRCTVSDVTDLFDTDQYSPDRAIECIYRACYAALCEASGA